MIPSQSLSTRPGAMTRLLLGDGEENPKKQRRTIASPYGTDHRCTSNAILELARPRRVKGTIQQRTNMQQEKDRKTQQIQEAGVKETTRDIFLSNETTRYLEPKCSNAAFFLLLIIGLQKLVNDGNTQQDTRTSTNGTHEISHDRQSSNTHASKRSGSRNVSVKYMK